MYRTPSFGSPRDSKQTYGKSGIGDQNNNSSTSKPADGSYRNTSVNKLDRSGSLSSVRTSSSRDGSVSSSDSSPTTYTAKSYIPLTQRGMLLRSNSKDSSNTPQQHVSTSAIRSYAASSELGTNRAMSGPLKAFATTSNLPSGETGHHSRHNRSSPSRTFAHSQNDESSLNGDVSFLILL